MEMEDEFGLLDYKDLIMNGSSWKSHNFIRTPATFDQHHYPVDYQFFSGHCDLTTAANDDRQDTEMMSVGFSDSEFIPSDCTAFETKTNETGQLGVGAGDGSGSNQRWRRQETLILLEIRSRLDPQFKEATQKGPLWDHISRIMFEDYGYQRSGKKCREKFENMYKYYKKTKVAGKTRRFHHVHQYRFFSQFNAICGDSGNAGFSVRPPESCCYSGNSSLQIHSSEDPPSYPSQKPDGDSLEISEDMSRTSRLTMKDANLREKRRKVGGKSWESKIKGFIDSQIKKMIEKQEAWQERFMKTIEQKEKESILREEEWRKQQKLRTDKEHRLWEEERSWILGRDAALMECLQKLTDDRTRRETLLKHHDNTKSFCM